MLWMIYFHFPVCFIIGRSIEKVEFCTGSPFLWPTIKLWGKIEKINKKRRNKHSDVCIINVFIEKGAVGCGSSLAWKWSVWRAALSWKMLEAIHHSVRGACGDFCVTCKIHPIVSAHNITNDGIVTLVWVGVWYIMTPLSSVPRFLTTTSSALQPWLPPYHIPYQTWIRQHILNPLILAPATKTVLTWQIATTRRMWMEMLRSWSGYRH